MSGDIPNLPQPDERLGGPAGRGDYVVRQGDCISSIAKSAGYFWKTIWDGPANTELKSVRKDPNVLFPGDRVTLPPKGQKKEPGGTERRHCFIRRGEPTFLCLQLTKPSGEQWADQPYRLTVDGQQRQGSTDRNGILEEPISGNARDAVLQIGDGKIGYSYRISLGTVDPTGTVSGAQTRLNNLAYGCPLSGQSDDATRSAIRRFQKVQGLQASGGLDAQTRQALATADGR